MKPQLCPGSARSPIAICLLLAFVTLTAQSKPIRLRNAVILTEPSATAGAQAQAALTPSPASGLFLIQFTNAVSRASRAELRSLGVRLLKYVPDDAFIARFNNVPPGKLSALSYVHWVGPYRADYKIHPRLAAAARAMPQTNQVLAVNVLLSPQATAAEVAGVRSLLSTVVHESDLRQGIFLRGALPPAELDALAQNSSVLWIERAPRHKLVDEVASKVVGGDDGLLATPTVTQQLGFDGTGVTVCVADTGLDSGDTNAMHPDLSGRVTGFQYLRQQHHRRLRRLRPRHPLRGHCRRKRRHRRDRSGFRGPLWLGGRL